MNKDILDVIESTTDEQLDKMIEKGRYKYLQKEAAERERREKKIIIALKEKQLRGE